MIKAVLFDFDGTLVTSLPHLHAAWSAAFKSQGKELSHEEVVSVFYLPREERAGRYAVDKEALRDAYYEHVSSRRAHYTLHEGVRELLEALRTRSIHRGILSFSSSETIRGVLQSLGADDLFDLVLGRDSVTHPKPDPESVSRALDLFSVSADEVLMVGDAAVDVETGRNAGIKTALYLPEVNHAYRDNEALAVLAPNYRFEHYRDLLPIIKSIP